MLLPSLADAKKKDTREFQASLEIIIDQSQGMAAKFHGTTAFRATIDAAKQAVEARTDPAAMAHVAWRTVGGAAPSASARGDSAECDATRLIVPEGASASPVLQVETKDKARGPLPLAAAIEAAAADRAKDKRQRSMLILTSGGDSCGRDVCNVAQDIHASLGLGSVHILLLGNDSEEAARLSCLGQVTILHNLRGLTDQIGDAIDAVTSPSQVTVTATKGEADVVSDVEVFSGSDAEPVLRGHTHEAMPILAGVYQIHVKATNAEGADKQALVEGWRRDVEIVSGAALSVRVPLGAQQGRLTAAVLFNGAPAPVGTTIAVLRLGDIQNPVATGRPGEEIRLPPGRYDVRATIPAGPLDNVELWQPQIHLLPGEPLKVPMAAEQKRGTLRVDASSGGDAVTDADAILITPGVHDAAEAVFETGKPISVAAGTYSVIARFDTPVGKVEGRKDGVVVAPDQQAVAPIEIAGLGKIRVDIAGRKADDGISVGLAKNGEETVLGSIDSFAEYSVPAGIYDLRVEEKSGKKSNVYWKKDVKVVAGEKASVSIVPPKVSAN